MKLSLVAHKFREQLRNWLRPSLKRLNLKVSLHRNRLLRSFGCQTVLAENPWLVCVARLGSRGLEVQPTPQCNFFGATSNFLAEHAQLQLGKLHRFALEAALGVLVPAADDEAHDEVGLCFRQYLLA